MLRLTDYPPMLLEERPFVFGSAGWLYEIKFDGYRLMAVVDGGRVELRTRGAANATAWFPEVVDDLAGLKGGPFVFDGEICVLDEAGRSDFDRLHARARRRRWYDGADPVVYCIFDVLVAGGHQLLQLPLLERKARLAKIFRRARSSILPVRYFEAEDGAQVFQQAVVPLGLEGLCAKRADSVYVPGARSPDWVKIKRKGAVPPERFKRGKKPALPALV